MPDRLMYKLSRDSAGDDYLLATKDAVGLLFGVGLVDLDRVTARPQKLATFLMHRKPARPAVRANEESFDRAACIALALPPFSTSTSRPCTSICSRSIGRPIRLTSSVKSDGRDVLMRIPFFGWRRPIRFKKRFQRATQARPAGLCAGGEPAAVAAIHEGFAPFGGGEAFR